jgi:hypothetical protein
MGQAQDRIEETATAIILAGMLAGLGVLAVRRG